MSSMRAFLVRSHRWSGLISILCGLILFLSWIIGNTLRDQAARIKTAIEAGQQEHHLYSELFNLQMMLTTLLQERAAERLDKERRGPTTLDVPAARSIALKLRMMELELS